MAQAGQLRAHLATKGLVPTAKWLDSFVASQKPSTPITALKQTVLFRLLASDIIQSLEVTANSSLPADVHDATMATRVLYGNIPVQLLSMEDIGCSRWSQLEVIEAGERGETTKGREIIRAVPGEEDAQNARNPARGPYRLTLQDIKGTQVYAFALMDIDVGTKMGAKILLKDVTAARGLLLLKPTTAVVFGGTVDALQHAWHEARKARLKSAIRAGSP